MDFQRLAGPRNVSLHLKYCMMFCACECLCTAESGEVTAGSLY